MSLLRHWRDAIRDSDIGSTAKLIGFVLSTYLTGDGRTGHDVEHPSPSRLTLARGAGLSVKHKDNTAAKNAIEELEQAGLLSVTPRRGWRGFSYQAVIPHVHAGLIPGQEQGSADVQSRTPRRFNPSPTAGSIPVLGVGESSESEKRESARPASKSIKSSAACVDCGLGGGLHVHDCPQAVAA